MNDDDVLAQLQACPPGERNALLYSDGSMSVFSVGHEPKMILEEREDSDRNETQPERLTQIVRVRCEVVRTLFVPSASVPSHAQARIKQLEAELAALRAQAPSPRSVKKS